MNVTFPDWALTKYPELANLKIGAYELISILVVNTLPFISSEKKDRLLSYLLFNPSAQSTITTSITLLLLGALALTVLIVYLSAAKKLSRLKNHPKHIFFELLPLHTHEQKPLSTKELFKVLHGVNKNPELTYSLEIVSTKKEGIRLVLGVPESDARLVKEALKTHITDLKIKTIEDYLTTDHFKSENVFEFGQTNPYPYPLNTPEKLDIQDPISYLASSMRGLASDELVSLQYVISPLDEKTSKKQADLLSRIINDEPIFEKIKATAHKGFFSSMLIWSLRIILLILFPWLVIAYYLVKPLLKKKKVVYTQGQKELVTSIKQKFEQPLFKVAIRAIIQTDSDETKQDKLRGLISAMSVFNNSFQALKLVRNSIVYNLSFLKELQARSTMARSHIAAYTNIFSTNELAALYHFPSISSGRVEDLATTHSKELSLPLSVKNTDFDTVFAQNSNSDSTLPIGLTDEDRSRHVYILGQTGSGKSTIIYHMAKEDIQKGRGLAIIDPHGDLAEDLLATIPEERINDCIYLNPFDVKHPIGINLLELTLSLDEDELDQEKELVCEGVISVFRRVFSNDEKANAHRIEYILRNAIYTAFTIPDATIFTVYELLNNPKMQKKVTRNLEDENLKNFWKNEFGKAGNFQVVKMVSGVTAKIGRFLFSPSAKRMLEQPKSTINFEEILNGKILICNLAEGKIGEDTSQLLGTTIMAKLQQAAMRRALTKASKRKPFYIFVDEFQNFATSSFTKLLSGGRKFGLRLTIAQQTTAQQEDRNVTNVILANTGTVVCFRTASPVDAKLMADQFKPYVDASDINNLPRYNFYMRLAAVEPEEPFSGTTLPIQEQISINNVEKIIKSSQQLYANKYQKNSKKSSTRVATGRRTKKKKLDKKSDVSTLV